jgi:hypothetical protein
MPRKIGFSTHSETFHGADFTTEEWDFVRAMAAYQKRWNRRYPTWREVLHVLLCLGYRKAAAPQPFIEPTPGEVELAQKVTAETEQPNAE